MVTLSDFYGWMWFVVLPVGLILFALFALSGCAMTYHQHGASEELHPNLPSPSEFREVCPM
jgi:hypothetical protein